MTTKTSRRVIGVLAATIALVLALPLSSAVPAVLVVLVPPAGPGASSDESSPPPVNGRTAVVGEDISCWEWHQDITDSPDCAESGPLFIPNRIGVYYCPAAGHTSCSQNGSPTTGTVDVGGYWGGTLVLSWCVQFYQGGISDTCAVMRHNDSIHANNVKGGAVFGDQEITGTYGGTIRSV